MQGKVQVNDTEIRSEIRALVAQNRFDTQQLAYRVAGGTVRFTGELHYLGGGLLLSRVASTTLSSFEREVSRVRGVRHVSLDLDNWRRLGTGEWQPVRTKRSVVLTLAG
jgi:hypothetical protein